MQNLYSRISDDENRIVNAYHERGNIYLVNNSDSKQKSKENSEAQSFQNISFLSETPLKILQTKIFNDSQPVLQPQKPKVIIKKKLRSASTPQKKKMLINPKKKALNSSKASIKTKNSSRNSSSSKILKNRKNSYNINNNKAFDITRIPN